jgi:hypothetical protein
VGLHPLLLLSLPLFPVFLRGFGRPAGVTPDHPLGVGRNPVGGECSRAVRDPEFYRGEPAIPEASDTQNPLVTGSTGDTPARAGRPRRARHIERIEGFGDHVVQILLWRFSGDASGAQGELRAALLWTFAGDLIRAVDVYLDPEAAIAAAKAGQPRSAPSR